MRVLVVGSGGREHAIIKALAKSREIDEIICAPGNGGIASLAKCVDIKATDLSGMTKFAKENGVDFCVVAPDDPLALGMVDMMEAAGIASFGPSRKAARIEASKAFAKDLMKKYGIPTAAYEIFDDDQKASAFIERNNTYPIVLKADGLALGKGVIIAADRNEAKAGLNELMVDKAFGKAGDRIVVEQFMSGPEVSLLAFTDGKTLRPMVASTDHKRALDDDKGLNTGGMGTIAPSPYMTEDIKARCMEEICLPTIKAMAAEGAPFKGCLYFGLMLTEKGPRVVEYNCRFGDPETQVVLPLLKSDFFTIMKACRNGNLADVEVNWSDGAAACVIEASGGYPLVYEKGLPISGLNSEGQYDGDPDVYVYHAGTVKKEDAYYTNGGRVLGVTATGNNLTEAVSKAYEAVGNITFAQMHCRSDIGKKAGVLK